MRDLKELIGATVLDAAYIDTHDFYVEDIPAFVLKLRDGSMVQLNILMDAEGNGPGFVDIIEVNDDI